MRMIQEKFFDISIKLEGLNRNASTHAAGLVILNSPIVNDVPFYYDANLLYQFLNLT